MTLIARMRFGAAPLYIGDALLSNTTSPPNAPRFLPAYSDVNAILPDDAWGYIGGLRQKVNLLNGGDLVVAWAGSQLQARIALKELQNAASDGATSSDHFVDVLRQKPDDELSDLTLLGTKLTLIPGQPSLISSFAMNCEMQEFISGVDCRVAGTGTERFKSILPHLLGPEVHDSGDYKSLERAWRAATGMAGFLIGEEVTGGGNLIQMWGGAFEAAHVANDRIVKIGNTLHTTWWLEKINAKQAALRMRLKVLKYDYVEDHLLVTVSEITPSGAEGAFHMIAPVLSTTGPTFPAVADFRHETLLCHILDIPEPSGNAASTTIAIANPNPTVEIEIRGGKTEIRVPSALFELIRDAVQPACPLEIVL